MFVLSKNKTLIIKAIAITLVILGHWGIFEYGGSWGVGLFLIVSGYGLTCSYYNNGLDNFLKKRVVTVLIPYALVMLLWIVIDYISGERYSILTICTSLLGINTKSPIEKTMWYISYLFLWYALFYTSFKFIKTKKYNLISMFLCSFIIILLYKLGLWTSKTAAHIYVFCFPIGVLLGILSNVKVNLKFKKYLIWCTIINLVVFICTAMTMKSGLLVMINVLSFSLTIVLLISLLNIKRYRIIEFIGELSFYLYLFEGAFLDIKYGHIFNFTHNQFLKFTLYLSVVIIFSLILRKLMSNSKFTNFDGKLNFKKSY